MFNLQETKGGRSSKDICIDIGSIILLLKVKNYTNFYIFEENLPKNIPNHMREMKHWHKAALKYKLEWKKS